MSPPRVKMSTAQCNSLLGNSYATAKGLFDSDFESRSEPQLKTSGPVALGHEAAPKADELLSSFSERYLPDKSVAERFGVQKQTIWRWAKSSPLFPKPIKFESGTTRWRLSDLIAYERQVMGDKR